MASDDAGTTQVEKIDHIQTSTRDLVDTRDRLQRWLAGRLPDGAEPVVSPIEAPSANGMSSETLLFDASWQEGGAARAESLVARVAPDPANKPVFPVYDLDAQFKVIKALGELGTVPVPEVHWSEPDSGPIGAPFFVMSRVEGQVPPDIMPYNFGDSWLFDASRDDQARLQDASVRVLAAIHDVDRPAERFAFLAPDLAGSALRRHVDGQWAYYQWVAGGARSPLIERCFAWLEDHWPAEEGPTVLSWGDSRIGNMMYRDFEPVAVFDWEMASLAPREVDLAWFLFLHRFFEDIAHGYGLDGMPHFLRRADVVATYEDASGYTPRDLDFYTMYAALRHGIVMSQTQRRAIHFGTAEMPDDIDDLIHHRSTLEEMLDGTYWSKIP
jgi:aminoglycoside phosphotransferase (APT) family kinase protein